MHASHIIMLHYLMQKRHHFALDMLIKPALVIMHLCFHCQWIFFHSTNIQEEETFFNGKWLRRKKIFQDF